ncbi:hypothetical protein JTE90_009272 [Oedothorax gibbosus]|uniref:Uncharacterized protein n=1 Tax=Oedothorax gibbosus TaxID=931172 RepID=A0AAV6V127_9ARAC|nr:hypothetical protein JTE90_009272 [Oedothorax gibbosus]
MAISEQRAVLCSARNREVSCCVFRQQPGQDRRKKFNDLNGGVDFGIWRKELFIKITSSWLNDTVTKIAVFNRILGLIV